MVNPLQVVQNFDVRVAAAFLRHPDIYGVGGDDMQPPATNVDLERFILQENVATFLLEWQGSPVGFIQFIQRNPIMAELHVGFLHSFRGKCAILATQNAMKCLFLQRGVLKVIALIASDCKHTLRFGVALGLKREGRITRGIMRGGQLRDLILMGVSKDEFLN